MESGEKEWEIQHRGSGWVSTMHGLNNKRFEYLTKILPAWSFKLLALGMRKGIQSGSLIPESQHWSKPKYIDMHLIFWNPWDLSLENSLESSSQPSLVERPAVTQVGRDIRSACSPALHLLSKGTGSSPQSPEQPFTELIPASPCLPSDG